MRGAGAPLRRARGRGAAPRLQLETLGSLDGGKGFMVPRALDGGNLAQRSV